MPGRKTASPYLDNSIVAYVAMLAEEIRFLKSQQIRATNFGVIMQIALLSLNKAYPNILTGQKCWLKILAIAAFLYTIYFIFKTEKSMCKCRTRQYKAVDNDIHLTELQGTRGKGQDSMVYGLSFYLPFMIINAIAMLIVLLVT